MSILLLAALLVQDTVENPEYRAWASFKPEDWVLIKGETGPVIILNETLYRLVSVDKDQAVVGINRSTQELGQAPQVERREIRIAARIPKAENWMDAAARSGGGTEELEVDGRKLACEWSEWVVDKGVSRKVWFHKSVPGGAVQVEERKAAETTRTTVFKFHAADATPAVPVSFEAKALNDAARAKTAPGVDLTVTDQMLSEAALQLSKAVEVPVFVDRTRVGPKRKVSWTLKKGTPLGDSLTAALKPSKLVWTLVHGVVILTDEAGKTDLDRNGPIAGPPDEALKKLASAWENRDKPLELRPDMTAGDALGWAVGVLGYKIDRGTQVAYSEPLGWGSTRPALVQLRLVCRSMGVQFEVRKEGFWFRSDPGALARGMDEASLYSMIQSARTAGYTGNKLLYNSLLPELRKKKERAQEIIRGLIDAPNEDPKGREVLKQLLKDIQ